VPVLAVGEWVGAGGGPAVGVLDVVEAVAVSFPGLDPGTGNRADTLPNGVAAPSQPSPATFRRW